MTDELEEIRKRDADLRYCATCGARNYGEGRDPHNITVEQCDAYLARGGQREAMDGHFCWNPDQHHPFVEGEIPAYEQAARDRRELLRLLDAS